MIFTGFKRKSAQLFFNRLIVKDLSNLKESASSKLRNVIIFIDEASDKESIQRSLNENFKLTDNQLEFIVFKDSVSSEGICDDCFSPKDFGWYGKIKSENLNSILTKKYDLLINYGKVENIYYNLLILQSKAAFKVGFSHLDNRLYDLMIGGENVGFSLFNSELKKYLEILNKI